jgi:hypothetical protein
MPRRVPLLALLITAGCARTGRAPAAATDVAPVARSKPATPTRAISAAAVDAVLAELANATPTGGFVLDPEMGLTVVNAYASGEDVGEHYLPGPTAAHLCGDQALAYAALLGDRLSDPHSGLATALADPEVPLCRAEATMVRCRFGGRAESDPWFRLELVPDAEGAPRLVSVVVMDVTGVGTAWLEEERRDVAATLARLAGRRCEVGDRRSAPP